MDAAACSRIKVVKSEPTAALNRFARSIGLQQNGKRVQTAGRLAITGVRGSLHVIRANSKIDRRYFVGGDAFSSGRAASLRTDRPRQ